MQGKKVSFELLKLTIDKKNGVNLEVYLPDYADGISMQHVFYITRPDLDENKIKSQVSMKYERQLRESMFADDIRDRMNEELNSSIEAEKERIANLPHAVMFDGSIKEIKNRDGTYMKIKLPHDDIVNYLYTNIMYMDQMMFIVGEVHSPFFNNVIISDIVSKAQERFGEETKPYGMMKITAQQNLVASIIKAEIIVDKALERQERQRKVEEKMQTATIDDVMEDMTNDTK